MKRPVSLTIVVVLQWIAATVGIISAFDQISAALELHDAGAADDIEAALVNTGVIDISGESLVSGLLVAGSLTLLIAFVRVMVAVYLARGRAWARMLLAIVAVVNLLGGLGFVLHDQWWRATVVVVIELVILGLLFNARASAYIKERESALVS